jgi:hypothetical protein
MAYAADAKDGPDGGPPSAEDDGGSEGVDGDVSGDDPGDGHGGGGGGDGDGEMSDSPTSSEEGDDGNAEPEDPEEYTDSEPGSPPPIPAEKEAMRKLGRLHQWNKAKRRVRTSQPRVWGPCDTAAQAHSSMTMSLSELPSRLPRSNYLCYLCVQCMVVSVTAAAATSEGWPVGWLHEVV